MRFLVTGAAGFIGFHVARRLCAEGHEVVGIDNLNDYYSVSLKEARLAELAALPGFSFRPLDIVDKDGLLRLFETQRFARVIHLAAQAGVRYSVDHPEVYVESNLAGYLNILEACRHFPVEHLLYASSSSVYGLNEQLPFSTRDDVSQPASLYAATKRANELMAFTYAHLYGIPATGLRFFTVYGPWGRPDMALFKFTDAILHGRPIDVYNDGQMSRDFTYIDDIVEGILRLQALAPTGAVPSRVLNIGRGEPVRLLDFIECLEAALGIPAEKNFMPLQPGDVLRTWADVDELAELIDFRPITPLATGVSHFVNWYRDYYAV
jgi:UDP-glucuronate 4-epimerase